MASEVIHALGLVIDADDGARIVWPPDTSAAAEVAADAYLLLTGDA